MELVGCAPDVGCRLPAPPGATATYRLAARKPWTADISATPTRRAVRGAGTDRADQNHRLIAAGGAHGRAQKASPIGAGDASKVRVGGQARDRCPGRAIGGGEDHRLTAEGDGAYGRTQEASPIGAGDASKVRVGGQARDRSPGGAIGGGEDRCLTAGRAHSHAQETSHIGAGRLPDRHRSLPRAGNAEEDSVDRPETGVQVVPLVVVRITAGLGLEVEPTAAHRRPPTLGQAMPLRTV